jgi:hypothetical protein
LEELLFGDQSCWKIRPSYSVKWRSQTDSKIKSASLSHRERSLGELALKQLNLTKDGSRPCCQSPQAHDCNNALAGISLFGCRKRGYRLLNRLCRLILHGR